MTTSVYRRVLGAQFDELHPTLQRYFGPVPPGSVGRGDGVYETAGSRHRYLAPVLAFLAWRHVLFPEYGRGIPFSVENRADGASLRAVRRFRFGRVERRMDDAMTPVGSLLVDRVGRRGGLEAVFTARVEDGGMVLRSTRLALLLRGARVPLPRFAVVTISERADHRHPERQHVDVRMRMPLLGEVFGYRGSFVYRFDAAAPQPPGDVGGRP